MWLRDWFRRLSRKRDRSIHPFDRQHGVDTSGMLYPDQLATGVAADAMSEGYYATAPSLFDGMIGLWRRHLGAAPLTSYHFVDLGCGKGRVLLLASLHAFRSVTGVELHPKLAAAARRNVRHWLRRPRACGRIDVVAGDALTFALPGGPGEPVVLFLFNAFNAEAVTQLVTRLSAAARKRTAPIDLLYLHPEQHAAVMAAEGVRLLADEAMAFSPEDAKADAFQVTEDRCTVYRLRF